MKPVCLSYLTADLVVCNSGLCYFFLTQIQLATSADSFAQKWHQSSSGKKQILHLSNSASKIKYCQLSFLFLRGEKKKKTERIKFKFGQENMLPYCNRAVGFRAFYDSKCLVDTSAASSDLSFTTMSKDLGLYKQTWLAWLSLIVSKLQATLDK